MAHSESQKNYWTVRQVYLVCASMAVVSSIVIMLLTWHFKLDPALYEGGTFNAIYQVLMGCYWFCVTGFIYAMTGLVIRSFLGKAEPKSEPEVTAESAVKQECEVEVEVETKPLLETAAEPKAE